MIHPHLCRSPLPWEEAAARDSASDVGSFTDDFIPDPHAPIGSSSGAPALSVPSYHPTSNSGLPFACPPPSASYQLSGGLQPKAVHHAQPLQFGTQNLASNDHAASLCSDSDRLDTTRRHEDGDEAASTSASGALTKSQSRKASLKKFVNKLKISTKEKSPVHVPQPSSGSMRS
jgi:hypothetical protein